MAGLGVVEIVEALCDGGDVERWAGDAGNRADLSGRKMAAFGRENWRREGKDGDREKGKSEAIEAKVLRAGEATASIFRFGGFRAREATAHGPSSQTALGPISKQVREISWLKGRVELTMMSTVSLGRGV